VAEQKLVECASCHKKVTSLLRIDGGMRQRLREATGSTTVPPEVCTDCYNDLSGLISKGAQLKAQHHAKEQQRMVLWRNRVELLKKARQQMDNKGYSEAAVLYEKYLRVLEIIYDIKAGDLNPELFNNRARSKEIGAIAMVFWDLVRIYDASPRYGDRQTKAAKKLAAFMKMSPVGKKIAGQAKDFIKQSKNPATIKLLLKQSGLKTRRCYIATAAFESENAPEVVILRAFRDEVLEHSFFGRIFIQSYYLTSPPIATWLSKGAGRRKPVRRLLKRVVTFVSQRFDLKTKTNL
jgi:hypothetical protein